MATIASDASRVYAAMRHGEVCKRRVLGGNSTPGRPFLQATDVVRCFLQVLVFNGCTFLLETVLEGRKEPVWQVATYFYRTTSFYDCQVGAGLHIVAAVTESCVTGLHDCYNDGVKVKVAEKSGWEGDVIRGVLRRSLAETGGKR